jgi:hypothetical protein
MKTSQNSTTEMTAGEGELGWRTKGRKRWRIKWEQIDEKEIRKQRQNYRRRRNKDKGS